MPVIRNEHGGPVQGPAGPRPVLAELMPATDGIVTIRPAAGMAGQILVGGAIAGAVDLEPAGDARGDGDVLVRILVCAPDPDGDQAFRALQLVLHHLATRSGYRTAVLAVPESDAGATAVAAASGFTVRSAEHGESLLARPVPPLTYSDGVVTIRRQRPDDIGAHLDAIDDEQIDWLWDAGSRRTSEAVICGGDASPDRR